MSRLSKQEYYDLLVRSARDGNFPAVEIDLRRPTMINCRYRTQSGKKCAVGVLIPDSAYDVQMEGSTVTALYNQYPVMSEICPAGLSPGDLYAIQYEHDGHATSPKWDADSFIADINALSCFKEVNRVAA